MSRRPEPAAAEAAVLGIGALGLWPLLGNGLATYDDFLALVDNPHIRDFSGPNLEWMLTSVEKGAYEPLAWLVFASIHALAGLTPSAYHAASIVVHSASGLLVLALGRRLGAGTWSAVFGAALFLLHPLQLETVAQAASLGDLLASCLGLASLYCWLSRRAGAALACFAASALCHWQAIALPAVFVLLDRLEGRREPLKRLAPFLGVVAALGAATLFVKASTARAAFPLALAPANLARELAFFAAKTLLPADLRTLHYLSGPLAPKPWPILPCAALALGVTALAWRGRASRAAWLSYAALLAPTSLLAWGGNFAVSTRYGYLALAVPAIAAAVALERLRPRWAPALAAAAALALIPAARAGSRVYRDGASILARDVRSDPAAPMTNLRSPADATAAGMRLWEDGYPEEALVLVRAAVGAAPDDARLRNDYGVLLASRGRLPEASEQFEAALKLDPKSAAVKANLARARKERN